MLKRIVMAGIIAGITLSALVGVSAEENISFMAMNSGSSMAYMSRDGENIDDYTQMVASSDSVVSPIVIDGSTYLPFRYITELVGYTDYVGSGNLKAKTFLYRPNGRGGSISFNNGKEVYNVDIGKSFEYEFDDDDIREIEFKNIEGSLYAPMRYLANVTGSIVDWDPVSGTIYFAKDEKTLKNFIEEDKSIKYVKIVSVMYKGYDNNLSYSDLYLKSENMEIKSVSKDMNVSKVFDEKSNYYSVNRVRKTLYYVNSDMRVCSNREGADKENEIIFYNMKNKKQDVMAKNIVTTKDKIYGIAVDDKKDVIGSLFEADLDGENFKFLNKDESAYNLLYRNYDGKDYIIYVDGRNHSTIYIIDIEQGEERNVTVMNSDYEKLIQNVDILTLGEDKIIYSDYENYNLHCLTFDEDELFEDESSYIIAEEKKISSYNRKELTDIRTLNYEDENKVLFFIGTSGGSEGVFYYDAVTGSVGRLTTSKNSKRSLAIMKMSNSIYRIYYYDNTDYKYDLMSVSEDGTIKINNNIELTRED